MFPKLFEIGSRYLGDVILYTFYSVWGMKVDIIYPVCLF